MGSRGYVAWDREDFQRAIRFPIDGRLLYDVLRRTDGPGPHLKHNIFGEVNFSEFIPNVSVYPRGKHRPIVGGIEIRGRRDCPSS